MEEFQTAVLNPGSKTMSVMHETFNLDESDVEMIKLFLDDFEEHGLATRKPIINKAATPAIRNAGIGDKLKLLMLSFSLRRISLSRLDSDAGMPSS